MLPGDIGRYTQERAAFHEASHAVYVWSCNGSVNMIQIGYDDATRQWCGAMGADPLPSQREQGEMLLAGGLGEALYVANVNDDRLWQINEPASRPALVAAIAAPANPLGHIMLTFTGPNNATKIIAFNRDTFSDDGHQVVQLAQQHALNLDDMVRNAINRLNDTTFWSEVLALANRFLLHPPRQLIWQIGYDEIVDGPRYRIALIEEKAKERLFLGN